MANLQSQIKRNRQNEKRHQRNLAVRSRVKTQERQFVEAIEAGDRDAAEEAYRSVTRQLDKAASKGVIHQNKADRKKSRLAKRLAAL